MEGGGGEGGGGQRREKNVDMECGKSEEAELLHSLCNNRSGQR